MWKGLLIVMTYQPTRQFRLSSTKSVTVIWLIVRVLLAVTYFFPPSLLQQPPVHYTCFDKGSILVGGDQKQSKKKYEY